MFSMIFINSVDPVGLALDFFNSTSYLGALSGLIREPQCAIVVTVTPLRIAV
jgi:hypothetical protein